jgi:hypothetical protein
LLALTAASAVLFAAFRWLGMPPAASVLVAALLTVSLAAAGLLVLVIARSVEDDEARIGDWQALSGLLVTSTTGSEVAPLRGASQSSSDKPAHSEVSGVVRHQRQIVDNGRGSDQQILRGNVDAA